ncbi:NUDIX domain-containing protein [Sphingobacterium sp. UT-1RO-CII-1]|uniref:NUDIX hydrolase n=1 Tax=Sphingobacterium sp. UT-1RO-CII-1 TaxID=2995225 RepID=UPI002279F6CE|nr:NUDIX domain-containing protein [Sphingobacterium sp. UT-1RO-CII-1]MCY4780502.1 NUDIX domain-containing protein [Sphingobacterium sp. UT-1RO-CII-1]
MNQIYFAGAMLTDAEGHLLVVRKKGSLFYMMPGGKIEKTESPVQALIRELQEEVGIAAEEHDLQFLGTHQTEAVNEQKTQIKGYVYALAITEKEIAKAQAEIEEIVWLTPHNYKQYKMAHLLEEYVLPRWLLKFTSRK